MRTDPWLLPPARPLIERLGAEFFRSLPDAPGVYLMRDEKDRLIYVGKAGNLRQRLGSYRYLTNASRKTIRLVHRVRKIEWEICASEPEARLRENELLRLHRPRFNRVNTYPQAYRFIELTRLDTGFQLAIVAAFPGMSPATGQQPAPPIPQAVRAAEALPLPLPLPLEASSTPRSQPFADDATRAGLHAQASASAHYGAFKSGVVFSFGALLRCLWAVLHKPKGLSAYPRALLLGRPPRRYAFAHPEAGDYVADLARFLGGTSSVLLAELIDRMPRPESAFHEQFHQRDRELLEAFFLHGPWRNRQLCRRHGKPSDLIRQEELDDMLVKG